MLFVWLSSDLLPSGVGIYPPVDNSFSFSALSQSYLNFLFYNLIMQQSNSVPDGFLFDAFKYFWLFALVF